MQTPAQRAVMYQVEDYGVIDDYEARGIRLVAFILVGDDGGVRFIWREGTAAQREMICKLFGIDPKKCEPLDLEKIYGEGEK